MNILAFDTALGAGSVAVVSGGAVRASRTEGAHKTLAENLLPMIEAALHEAALGYSDIDRLAVTVGPGNFTGVRIGIATARGLAIASGLPVVGVTSLHAIAANAAHTREGVAAGVITACIDARRGEVYLQSFRTSALEAMEAPAVMPVGAARSALPAGTLVVGSGAALVDPDQQFARAPAHCNVIAAAEVARIAEYMALPDRLPGPLYLRAPDAKLPAGTAPL